MSYETDGCYGFYKETVRVARKTHKCSACKRTLAKGHRYMHISAQADDSVHTYKRCGACQVVHKHLRRLCRELDCDMWPDEELNCGLSYESEWGAEPPGEIAALPFLADQEASALLAEEPS